MNLTEVIEKYGNFELSEEIVEKLESLTRPKNIFNLKHHDDYWWINGEGFVDVDSWSNWGVDFSRLKIGNIFMTEEEAKADLEKRRVETLLLKHGGRRKFNACGMNYWIQYDIKKRTLQIGVKMDGMWDQGTVYFDGIMDAECAIEAIGEKRIINALFKAED